MSLGDTKLFRLLTKIGRGLGLSRNKVVVGEPVAGEYDI
jgi:hypothetical protein